MKTVKIILGIITALTLVFFATGLFVKETTYTVKTSMKKPLQKVFRTFNSKTKVKKWEPTVQSVDEIVLKKGVVGSVYEVTTRTENDTVILTEKVIAYIPNKKITYRSVSENFLKIDDYSFQKKGDSTTILKKVVYESNSYLMQCVFPYLKKSFIEADQKKLDNFSAYIKTQ